MLEPSATHGCQGDIAMREFRKHAAQMASPQDCLKARRMGRVAREQGVTGCSVNAEQTFAHTRRGLAMRTFLPYPKGWYGIFTGLAMALLFVGVDAFAQGAAVAPGPAPFRADPLPTPQEQLLSPIPNQFGWIHRQVRPNSLLEGLLDLQEGPPQLFVSVTLAEAYSDNFLQVDGGRGEEYRTSVNIGTAYRLEDGNSFVSLANSMSATYDARAEESHFGFANLSLNAGHQMPPWSLALSESFIRDDDPGEAALTGLRRGRRSFLQNRVSPQIRYAFSPLTAVSSAYTNTIVHSEDVDQNNAISHAITTNFRHQFSRSLTGNIRYAFTISDSEVAADTQAHNATVDLEYLVERLTSLSWRAFSRITDRSNGGVDSQIYGASVGVRRQLTTFLSAFVALGATSLDFEGRERRVRVNWQVDLDGAFPITRLTTLTLTARQHVDDTLGEVDNVGIVLRQSVTLLLSHVASRALRASLFANYTRTELLEDTVGTTEAVRGREDSFWRAGARASYALTRVLSLSVAYLHQRRDSNLARNDFDENRVTIALSTGFSVF